jgi:alpha-L-fucosidase
VTFDHLELRENLLDGQCIDMHEVLLDGRPIVSGRTVGVRRWHAFPVATGSRLTIQLDNSDARLVEVTAFHAGHEQLPALEPQPDSVHPSKF